MHRAVVVLALLVIGCSSGQTGGTDIADDGGPVTAAAELDWAAWAQADGAARPWVRWWWPGTDVEDSQLAAEIGLLAAAGFGGAEIQPIDAGLAPLSDPAEAAARTGFDTPEFYEHVAMAASAAATHGVAVDLTLGSGWPSGGSFVSLGDSMKTLLWWESRQTGPQSVTLVVGPPAQSISQLIGETAAGFGEPPTVEWHGDGAELVALLAAPVVGGERDADPLNLTDQVVLDGAGVVDLTGAVSEEGLLSWEVPEGTWQVVALFLAPDGGLVKFGANAEVARVADHLDEGVVRGTLAHLVDQPAALQEQLGEGLAGLFVDSFELSTERHVSVDFEAEFLARRGYDLRPLLPLVLVPGADNHLVEASGIERASPFSWGEADGRVQWDYQQTVSDLFVERFVDVCTEEAAKRALTFRIQPYGLGIDVIRAAGHAGIPEAEQLYAGGVRDFLKVVSAGAQLYGGNLVSAESLVWGGAVHMTTPVKAKAAADKLFAAGINRLVVHGFPYGMEEGYGEAGWHPFCSQYAGAGYTSHLGPTNAFWEFWPAWVDYVRRMQWAMQWGEPSVDVLVYYPFLGFSGAVARLDPGAELLANGAFPGEQKAGGNELFAMLEGLFGPMSEEHPATWLERVRPVLRALEAAGYTWSWANGESLGAAYVSDGRLVIRGRSYGGVVLAEAPWLDPEAAEALAAAREDGLAVVVAGAVATRQPGYRDFEAGDGRVVAALAAVPRISSAQDLAAELAAGGCLPALALEATERVQVGARSNGDGAAIFLLTNPGPEACRAVVRPQAGCVNARWVDGFAAATWAAVEAAEGAWEVALPGYGSRLLLCGLTGPEGAEGWSATAPLVGDEPGSEVEGWSLHVVGDDVGEAPGGDWGAKVLSLGDWKAYAGLEHCSSVGRYTTSIGLEAAPAAGEELWLRFGAVHGAARVEVNGQPAGSVMVPPYAVEITGAVAAGNNEIVVSYTPPRRNRYIGLAASNPGEYGHYGALAESPAPTGIIGPALLVRRQGGEELP